MKKIILLLLSFAFCLLVSADRRGETFEKDGLIYTIASECVFRNYKNDTSMPESITHSSRIRNEGDVYVSGITFSNSDSVLTIPPVVYFPSTFNRKDTTMARYNVLGIGEKAFKGAKLKDIVIPNGLKFIGNEAFQNMELSGDLLVVPSVGVIKENVFDGVKAKVLFVGDSKFEETFKKTDNLPDFYVIHSSGIMNNIFYSIGKNVYGKWISENELYSRRWARVSKSTLSRNPEFFDIHQLEPENRGKQKVIAPKFKIRQAKKFEKVGSDIDMLPPYEYESRNSYTGKRDVFQDFTMDGVFNVDIPEGNLYRCRKDTVYFYFTNDGKPITDKESLIDDNGKDPFGLQVHSPEEMKAKKASKEREQNLNKKVNTLKNMFGF